MTRSPFALAALATAAIPGLDARDVRADQHSSTDFDLAIVTDDERRRWVVRAPLHAGAGAALEAELALLAALEAHVDGGTLPFDVPRLAGSAALPEGGRAIVYPALRGSEVRLESLRGGPGLAAALGRTIAAIHELPTSVVENAGLPVYEAHAYRDRRQSEVDEAARTGKVPTVLLRRWESKLEDVGLWRFRPTVVHGDLTASHVLTDSHLITGVLGWGEAKVADPADDLAWLLVAAPSDAVDSITEAYQLRRTELKDPHLMARAELAGELALARWLLFGVRTKQDDVVEDAVAMLDDLAEHVQHDEATSAARAITTAHDDASVAGEHGTGSVPDSGEPRAAAETSPESAETASPEDQDAAPR